MARTLLPGPGDARRRRRPVGYLLSALLVVKGFAMAAAIVATLLSAWAIEGTPGLPALLMFSLLAAMLSWLGLRVYTAEPRTEDFHARSVAL